MLKYIVVWIKSLAITQLDAIDSLEMAVNEIDEIEVIPYLEWTEY